jgi:energy-coupling factor transporter ATP-binding protein EcfA2
VLLCDEPTGALDSATGIIVLEALARVNEETGATTAIITHNAGIRKIAHRVFSFLDGRDRLRRGQRRPHQAIGGELVNRLSMLDRKLLRDLGRLWAQALAVALVMACGVMTLILAWARPARSMKPAQRSTTAPGSRHLRYGDASARKRQIGRSCH